MPITGPISFVASVSVCKNCYNIYIFFHFRFWVSVQNPSERHSSTPHTTIQLQCKCFHFRDDIAFQFSADHLLHSRRFFLFRAFFHLKHKIFHWHTCIQHSMCSVSACGVFKKKKINKTTLCIRKRLAHIHTHMRISVYENRICNA